MVPENDANITAGWWYTYPSEKYDSQLGLSFPMYGKIKNVPNHQPDWVEIRIIQKSQQVQWERLLWRSVCHVRIPMDPNRTPRKSNNSSTTVVIGLVSEEPQLESHDLGLDDDCLVVSTPDEKIERSM
jgi:hypothetical protein